MEAFSGLFLNGFIRESGIKVATFNVVTIAIFSTLMASIGHVVGNLMQGMLDGMARGVFIGVLAILGIKMVIKSFKPKFQEMTYELHKPRIMAGFALALSINAFLAGLALSAFNFRVSMLLLSFFVIYALVSIAAIIAGRLSKKFFVAARLLFSGGLLLTAGAIYSFLELFNVI